MRFFCKARIPAFCFVLGAWAHPAPVSDTVELPQREARGDPHSGRLRAGQSEVVLRPEDWEGRAVSLADLVAEQAGIETRRYGGMGSFQTVVVRGTGGDRLQVYLDDVPLNSAGGGPVDLGKLNPDLLERIEIRKGIAPAGEGGNSMGGVLRLYTRGGDQNRARVALSAGSHGTQQHSLSGGLGGGPVSHRLSVFANVGYSRSDNDFRYLDRNHTPYNPGDDFWTTRENGAFRELDVHAQARLAFGANQAVRLKAARSANSGGLPGREGEVTRTAGFSNRLVQYLAAWERTSEPEGRLLSVEISLDDETPRFHWTREDPVGWSSGRDTTEIASEDVRARAQLRWELPLRSGPVHAWGLSLLAAAGNETMKPKGENAPSDNPSWNNRRRFVLGAADLSYQPDCAWTFTLGGHGQAVWDHTEGGLTYYGSAVPPGESFEVHPAGRLGALWRPLQASSFFANAGWFYHLPSLVDRYGGRWGMVANPDLRPERGLNAEAGARWRWPSGFLEACLFRNRTDDAVLYLRSANLIKPYNLDAAMAQGVELTLEQALPRGWRESLVATAQRTENLSDTYYRGLALPDQPAWRHLLKTRVPLPLRLSLEHAWDFRTRIYRDPGNFERLPAQNLHHAVLQWNWKRRIRVSAGVENLTDTYYENAYDAYPYPGRQFKASLAWSL